MSNVFVAMPAKLRNNNPAEPIADSHDIHGGARVVADWNELIGLSATVYAKLQENVSRVRVMAPRQGNPATGTTLEASVPNVPTWYILTNKSTPPPADPISPWELPVWEVDGSPNTGNGPGGPVSWNDVTDKPTAFNPTAHGHTVSQIDGLAEELADKASIAHGHQIGDIEDLESELEGKELIANKITQILGISTHEQYGSAAAVWQLIELVKSGLLDGVVTEGNTLQKLFNLIQLRTRQFDVDTITERDAINIRIGDYVMVGNDGDGHWALYRAATAGTSATYRKVSDPDLLNAAMSASQIKAAYESNSDTNNFSNAYKAMLDGLATALAGKASLTHGHAISDVTGLAAALADLYPASNPAGYVGASALANYIGGTNSTRTTDLGTGSAAYSALQSLNKSGIYTVASSGESIYDGTWLHVENVAGSGAWQLRVRGINGGTSGAELIHRRRTGDASTGSWTSFFAPLYQSAYQFAGAGNRQVQADASGGMTATLPVVDLEYKSVAISSNTFAHTGSGLAVLNQVATAAVTASFTWNITSVAQQGCLFVQKGSGSNVTLTLGLPTGFTAICTDNGWSDYASKQMILQGASGTWVKIVYEKVGTVLSFTVLENKA